MKNIFTRPEEDLLTHMNLALTVAELAPLLERELRQWYGDTAYELLERRIALGLAERTETEDAQFFGMLGFIGSADDDAVMQALGLIWMAKKHFKGAILMELVESIRTQTTSDLLDLARFSIRSSLARAQGHVGGVGTLYELGDRVTSQASLYNPGIGLLVQRGTRHPLLVIGVPSGVWYAAQDMDQVVRLVQGSRAAHPGWVAIPYRLTLPNL